ncbi:hypothetical protein B5F53_10070 [Blautia sp. An249]|uniref:fluoride efflux transporter CrcB n=1 Tax=Blautia sp. An249 TaxID=1965603 RepID=UPI000B375885|nr:fluoride efflux transporter CrcB [Blautia sp. An249]OUO78621.1 hypothetical protein B5F53_10070 [Blautia sp. An249]
MRACLAVGAGGCVGAVLRYLLGLLPVWDKSPFPFSTLLINTIGAFIIGVVSGYAMKHTGSNEYLILFLKTGLCGGFTTFSTFSLETLQLYRNGNFLSAGCYAAGSVLICVTAAGIGQWCILRGSC